MRPSGEVKIKFTLEQAMKAQRGSRGSEYKHPCPCWESNQVVLPIVPVICPRSINVAVVYEYYFIIYLTKLPVVYADTLVTFYPLCYYLLLYKFLLVDLAMVYDCMTSSLLNGRSL
jgi:hypothetical protein